MSVPWRASFRWAVLLALLAAAFVAWKWRPHPRPVEPVEPAAVTGQGAPLVMHTQGGNLEIATVSAKEAFDLPDPKTIFGINLGTTHSQIQVTAIYRYHIEMARQWPIRIYGKTAVVEAGEVKPTLPVSFDSATMQQATHNGWARFNKVDHLQKLEQSLTPQLEARAPNYLHMAQDAGRKTIAEFVTAWLVKERQWRDDPDYRIEVVYPGEASSFDRGAPVANPARP